MMIGNETGVGCKLNDLRVGKVCPVQGNFAKECSFIEIAGAREEARKRASFRTPRIEQTDDRQRERLI
jgi:hypothetical protein